MTDKLYLKDAYCSSFDATIVSVETCDGGDAHGETNDANKMAQKFCVVLDRTAFFPEGGGQPSDVGTIGGVEVVDVQISDGIIKHYTAGILTDDIKASSKVTCKLCFKTRYERMQGHTGEHILSGIVHKRFGYDNVGFHMSSSERLITVDFNGPLTPEEIIEVELAANDAIYKNASVTAYFPSEEELATLDFRSKKELTEDLRIIRIGEDIDCCACCAPHVATTGEVGLIKIIDFYPYKKGVRIEMLAGKNALLDYIELNKKIKELMRITSAPRTDVSRVVREKYDSYNELNYEYQKLSNRLAFAEMKLNTTHGISYAILSPEDISFDDLRYCANKILEQDDSEEVKLCLLFARGKDANLNQAASSDEASEYAYVVSSKNGDVGAVVKALNSKFDGKGGGRNGYAQGRLGNASDAQIIDFILDIAKE